MKKSFDCVYVRYHVAQVALENGFSDTEGYVRPDVEERPPKLLHATESTSAPTANGANPDTHAS